MILRNVIDVCFGDDLLVISLNQNPNEINKSSTINRLEQASAYWTCKLYCNCSGVARALPSPQNLRMFSAPTRCNCYFVSSNIQNMITHTTLPVQFSVAGDVDVSITDRASQLHPKWMASQQLTIVWKHHTFLNKHLVCIMVLLVCVMKENGKLINETSHTHTSVCALWLPCCSFLQLDWGGPH